MPYDSQLPLIKAKGVSKTFRKGEFIGLTPLLLKIADFVHRLTPFKKPGFLRRLDRYQRFVALNNVDFEIKPGEKVGVIGLNGAGKTTLLKILCGIMEPDVGTVQRRGRIIPLLGLAAGFNAEFTGRQNIYTYGSVLGMKKSEIDRAMPAIAEFSEIEEFFDTPVKRYSKGMRARISMAVAFNIRPDVLIIDEVLAVGDIPFRAKCMKRIGEVCEEGVALVFVSHSMARIEAATDRCLLMRSGAMIKDDATNAVIDFYRENDLKLIGLEELDIDDEEIGDSEFLLNAFETFEEDQNPDAPVALIDASLRDDTGNLVSQINRDSSIFLSMTVTGMSPDITLYPRFKLYNENWELMFPMIWPDGEEGISLQNSTNTSILLEIPGDFLLPGKYRIGLGLFSYAPLVKHVNRATQLSFQVTKELTEARNPEYSFPRQVHGLITPKFEWRTEDL